jgi:hypothetical protein
LCVGVGCWLLVVVFLFDVFPSIRMKYDLCYGGVCVDVCGMDTYVCWFLVLPISDQEQKKIYYCLSFFLMIEYVVPVLLVYSAMSLNGFHSFSFVFKNIYC